MTTRPALMTVSDVAARFGVSESTVRVWLTNHDAGRGGGVPALLPDPLARGVVWLAEEIEAVAPQIEARSTKGGRPRTKPAADDVASAPAAEATAAEAAAAEAAAAAE